MPKKDKKIKMARKQHPKMPDMAISIVAAAMGAGTLTRMIRLYYPEMVSPHDNLTPIVDTALFKMTEHEANNLALMSTGRSVINLTEADVINNIKEIEITYDSLKTSLN